MTGMKVWPRIALLLVLFSAGCGEDRPRAGTALEARVTRPAPTVGVDSALLAQAVAQAESLPRLRTLLVARHGEMQLERRFRGPALDAPANVKSVSKSILSAVVGIAIAEGHLAGPDHAIGPFFERYIPAHESDKRGITIGNLLSMQSGLESTSGARYGAWVTSRDWVRYALDRPLVAEPGTARLYSTGNSHLLAAVVTQATGQSLWAYARERLAVPLGISLPRWPADPQGIYFGGNEMRLTPRDLVKFGELYRNNGRHEGVQIIPEEWIRESLRPRAASRWTDEGYGYGWFITQIAGYRAFYGWGYGGQFVHVVPELELTVVMTSDPDAPRERDHLGALRRLMRDYIVPAAVAGREHAPAALPPTTG
jgi:CubicO group peptidase (beta-lactamase class C family)